MAALARWCFEHRWRTVAAWLLALTALAGMTAAAGTSFTTDLSLPGTDSQEAAALLTASFPAAAGEGDQVVIQTAHGATIRSGSVRPAVTAALARAAAVPGVASVAGPYGPGGAAQVSRAGTVAFARVTWDTPSAQVTRADAVNLIRAAESADGPDVQVSLSGPAITSSERAGLGRSVGVGIAAALIVLLIVFGGALLASVLPLVAALLALGVGTALTGLLSNAVSISSVSTQLAVLIGLGVGVDYGLFIIGRYRTAVKTGMPYPAAAALAARTSGRTVLLAGSTVCIALLGQFALGVSFLDGVSVAAALAVALTMATSLTLLPALLGFLGPRVLSRRERRALAASGPVSAEPAGFWLRWARFVEARKLVVALGALAAVVAIALPAFGLSLGTSDASTDPPGSTTHQAYAALARGFGPGFNGPLELAARTGSAADGAAFRQLLARAARTPGVASVTPALTSPGRTAELATIYPASGPQAPATISLVNRLRADLIPQAARGTSLVVHVGGVTAANIDFAGVLASKLPLFIAVVVILAFILLLVVFHSLLIPLVASVMNLLSVGAGLGALNAVFHWGWGGSVLGLAGTGPVDSFVPVVMFSVLFGLSMDYLVFLVSRIQEEWHQLHHAPAARLAALSGRGTRRNHQAITGGLASSGRIIAGAASIMVLVFGSFLLGGHRILQEFGFALGFSVLIDALIIRGLLVPAVMHLLGPANWTLPAWLDRILPRLSASAAGPARVPEPEPEAGHDPVTTS
ncbi:MAG TPA: MMPL family transporter [Streptosporangiaceae bacterium]|jgi:RND superfamily putative drug exporter